MTDSLQRAPSGARNYTPAALNVLLFEDNAIDAALIKRFLRTVGVPAAQIHIADTIPSALQILTRERVDICVTDYHLRPNTGFDLMDEARRFDVDVPFIVVSALDDRAIDDGALAHGAYDFLVKGELTVEGLERAIRYALAQHARESELTRAAYIDVLTGLPNRAALVERLTQAVAHNAARGGMVGVALFNLNGTKFINEAFGQGVGDDILRCSAARLSATREPAHLAARLGGDEFAVVMTDFLLASQALATAKTLGDAMTGAVETRDGKHIVTVAGGVAALAVRDMAPGFSARATAERLLQQASQAMFAAKHTARRDGRSHIAVAHVH